LHTEIKRLLAEGKISKIVSKVNSPIQIVPKGKSWRFTVNYPASGVNDAIENDKYQLPLIMPKLPLR
jgi:hypothetical protein